MNVELLTIDKRTFTTDEANSMTTLFGESSEGSAQYRSEITTMATRLATVFASLKVGVYNGSQSSFVSLQISIRYMNTCDAHLTAV